MKGWLKGHKKIIVGIVIAVIVCVAAAITIFFFFGKKKKTKDTTQVKQNTVALTKMDLTNSVSATGTLESATTKTISASVSNVEVKKVLVEEGDTVKKGDVLAEFDKTDLQESYEEALETYNDTKTQTASELSSAKRKLSEAQETYTTQKAKYAKAVKEAKATYTAAKKAVSTAKTAEEKTKANETQEKAKSAYEQAVEEQTNGNKQNKNSVTDAKESVTTTTNNNKKSLREAKKNVDDAKELVDQCKVKATMDGTVTAVGVETGDSYSGGDMFEISDCSDLMVSTTVSEYDIADVKKGQKVVILTDATDDTEINGEITYVAVTTGSSLSSSSSSSSNSSMGMSSSSSSDSSSGYEVRIKVKDKNDALRVGMTAKCSIILDEVEDVYAVPYDAIHTNTRGESVIYTLDKSTNIRSEVVVTKGMESDYYVEVSGDGLSEDLQVIIPSDETSSSKSDSSKDSSSSFSLPGTGGGSSGGGMGGGQPGGGMGGGPGM